MTDNVAAAAAAADDDDDDDDAVIACAVFVGVLRWQSRVWSLVSKLVSQSNSTDSHRRCPLSDDELKLIDIEVFNARNHTLKEVRP